MDAVVNPISRELQGLLDENKHTSYGPALAELVQVFYQAKRGEDQKLLEVLRKIVPVLERGSSMKSGDCCANYQGKIDTMESSQANIGTHNEGSSTAGTQVSKTSSLLDLENAALAYAAAHLSSNASSSTVGSQLSLSINITAPPKVSTKPRTPLPDSRPLPPAPAKPTPTVARRKFPPLPSASHPSTYGGQNNATPAPTTGYVGGLGALGFPSVLNRDSTAPTTAPAPYTSTCHPAIRPEAIPQNLLKPLSIGLLHHEQTPKLAASIRRAERKQRASSLMRNVVEDDSVQQFAGSRIDTTAGSSTSMTATPASSSSTKRGGGKFKLRMNFYDYIQPKHSRSARNATAAPVLPLPSSRTATSTRTQSEATEAKAPEVSDDELEVMTKVEFEQLTRVKRQRRS
ncbi:hypothetical protein B0J14DRAFT_682624 [Halenospora varia]|nr:hypothetical protein B0J14DRAFT_682624 [Halenospora varia]